MNVESSTEAAATMKRSLSVTLGFRDLNKERSPPQGKQAQLSPACTASRQTGQETDKDKRLSAT